MKALQKKDKNTLAAFNHKCWGFRLQNLSGIAYQAAFYLDELDSIPKHKKIN
jgi:hypothetical protein